MRQFRESCRPWCRGADEPLRFEAIFSALFTSGTLVAIAALMKLRSLAFVASFGVVAATGCAPAPLTVSVDNQNLSFNRIDTTAESTTDVIAVTVTGSADPVPSAIDDEYTFSLRLGFNRAMLATAPLHAPLTVHGVAQFGAMNANTGGNPTSTYEAASDESPIVVNASAWSQCFCSRTGASDWAVPRPCRVIVDAITADRASVHYDLFLDGGIPNRTFQTSAHATLSGSVPVPLR